jgi:transcriptional regulator with XRE-family HTH domain
VWTIKCTDTDYCDTDVAPGPDVATLGQKIRAAREAHGLTQAELAARANVAQAYVSCLDQDQREPSLTIAARIARELEIPLDELANTLTQ